MIVSARGGPWPSVPLALCWVLPRRSPPRMRMFCPASTAGPPLSASLADWGSLPFWIWAEIAKVMKLSSSQPTAKIRIQRSQGRLPPVSRAEEAADAAPAADSLRMLSRLGLRDPVPQAGPGAIDRVRAASRRCFPPSCGGLLTLLGRALLTAPAAAPVDRVLGLLALFGLA